MMMEGPLGHSPTPQKPSLKQRGPSEPLWFELVTALIGRLPQENLRRWLLRVVSEGRKPLQKMDSESYQEKPSQRLAH